MKNRIAILGCGWLGWPLAKALLNDGFEIHGSTTSKEKLKSLREDGIHPFTLALTEDAIEGDIEGFLSNVNILIINLPPKLRGDHKENYVKKIQLLHRAVKASTVKKVVFVSSTSVYGDIEGDVTELTAPVPATESGRQLLDSESIFREETSLKVTVVRFGGLIGPERHPVTMLSGRKNLSNGNFPVNLIHLNDCIKIISEILKNNWWNETINGVYPNHPTKQRYYTSKAIQNGLQIPEYETNSSKIGKTVSSYILTNQKDFVFTTTL